MHNAINLLHLYASGSFTFYINKNRIKKNCSSSSFFFFLYGWFFIFASFFFFNIHLVYAWIVRGYDDDDHDDGMRAVKQSNPSFQSEITSDVTS